MSSKVVARHPAGTGRDGKGTFDFGLLSSLLLSS